MRSNSTTASLQQSEIETAEHIGAILGYSEMVEPQLTPGTKPAQHVDEIRRAAERGRDLIDNILTFGRRRDARVRPVQVHTLFEEAASLLRASLPAGVGLVIDNVLYAAFWLQLESASSAAVTVGILALQTRGCSA